MEKGEDRFSVGMDDVDIEMIWAFTHTILYPGRSCVKKKIKKYSVIEGSPLVFGLYSKVIRSRAGKLRAG